MALSSPLLALDADYSEAGGLSWCVSKFHMLYRAVATCLRKYLAVTLSRSYLESMSSRRPLLLLILPMLVLWVLLADATDGATASTILSDVVVVAATVTFTQLLPVRSSLPASACFSEFSR